LKCNKGEEKEIRRKTITTLLQSNLRRHFTMRRKMGNYKFREMGRQSHLETRMRLRRANTFHCEGHV
jgi:hypothetical protein